ncbi:MAG: hypothetical protein NVSMB31_02300 [Vulcanimicrobiaceae bacterium]
MIRRISLALLVALPGSLIGHVVAYALTGHALSDARHGYLEPALVYSSLVLGVLCAVFVLDALARAARRSEIPERLGSMWAMLSAVQVALFWAIERAESATPGWQGYLVQIGVALLGALALVFFAHVLARCERAAWEVQEYLGRRPPSPLASVLPAFETSPAFALRMVAGRARFSRPPPHS